MANQPPQQKLRPKRYSLGVGGLSLFGTGGCLMWTVILIPLALPLALLGAAMMIWSRFIAVEVFTCPVCEQKDRVEMHVQVVQCPACERTVKRTDSGWQELPART